jgi:hypothetical protein
MASKVHSVIVSEADWYGHGIDKEALQTVVLQEAKDAGATYTVIMVQPDPILSISPKPNRHVVWQHTFRDLTRERTQFEHDLYDAFGRSRLELHEKQAIVRKVFDL